MSFRAKKAKQMKEIHVYLIGKNRGNYPYVQDYTFIDSQDNRYKLSFSFKTDYDFYTLLRPGLYYRIVLNEEIEQNRYVRLRLRDINTSDCREISKARFMGVKTAL